jgi:hypothetical protein
MDLNKLVLYPSVLISVVVVFAVEVVESVLEVAVSGGIFEVSVDMQLAFDNMDNNMDIVVNTYNYMDLHMVAVSN